MIAIVAKRGSLLLIATALVVHVATFFDADLLLIWPWLAGLHFIALGAILAHVLHYQNRAVALQQRTVWNDWKTIAQTSVACYVALVTAYMICKTHGAVPIRLTDSFVLQQHGHVLSRISLCEFLDARALQTRAFSAFWLASLLYVYAFLDRRVRLSSTRSDAKLGCWALPILSIVLQVTGCSLIDGRNERREQRSDLVFIGHNVNSPLVIFFPGTNLKPLTYDVLLRFVAREGCTVIGLNYQSDDAYQRESHLVAKQNDVERHALTRLKEILKDSTSSGEPGIRERYLDSSGELRWNRVIVAGHSSGAGVAALLGSTRLVKRVVLFSGPWGSDPLLLAMTEGFQAVTPAERWWAERHQLEMTAGLLQTSFQILGVPPAQVLVFGRANPPMQNDTFNPHHLDVVTNPTYAEQWKKLFGTCGDS